MKKIYLLYKVVNLLGPVSATSPQNTAPMDITHGVNNMIVLSFGNGSGALSVSFQESDDGINWSNVAIEDIPGTYEAVAHNSTAVFSYLGYKKYVRAVIDGSNYSVAAFAIYEPYDVPVMGGRWG